MKAITNKTFAGFVQSLKQGIMDGYASCAKAEYKNGFYSAVLEQKTDSGYVSAVTKMKEDETNSFKITFFVEGLANGIYVTNSVKAEDLHMLTSKEDALKVLEETVEVTGQYDIPPLTAAEYEAIKQASPVSGLPKENITASIEKKQAQKRQRK